jgi:hypothetical protein
MAHLDRDHRGYPIPVMVFRDPEGKPHFTVNNEGTRVIDIIIDERCSICGTPLLRERWFVGGPLSAFHAHGAYHDPPMHRDCLHYALRVCPYLAMASYTHRIDTRTIKTPIERTRFFIDNTQVAERPEIFVAVCTTGQEVRFKGTHPRAPVYVIPHRPYKRVEFWRNGKQISETEGMRLVRPILEAA